MSVPTFRFLAWSDGAPIVDAQFWRDVDASDRLSSRFKANLYLRELCRSKAWEDAALTDEGDHFACKRREHALLREVVARGYRLFGPDVEALSGVSLRPTG
jgi:hypothetical protein